MKRLFYNLFWGIVILAILFAVISIPMISVNYNKTNATLGKTASKHPCVAEMKVTPKPAVKHYH